MSCIIANSGSVALLVLISPRCTSYLVTITTERFNSYFSSISVRWAMKLIRIVNHYVYTIACNFDVRTYPRKICKLIWALISLVLVPHLLGLHIRIMDSGALSNYGQWRIGAR